MSAETASASKAMMNSESISAALDFFLDPRHFPRSLEDLPVHGEVPAPPFWRVDEDGYPEPAAHWAFLTELTDTSKVEYYDYHHQVMSGEHAVQFFYEKDAPQTFKWSQLRRGHTLCVRYAERATLSLFDTSYQGVRVDSLDYAAVLPFGLSRVEELLRGKISTACCACGETGATKMCVCRVARFCGRECQKRVFRVHNAQCKELRRDLEVLVTMIDPSLRYDVFDKYEPFAIKGKLAIPADFLHRGTVH